MLWKVKPGSHDDINIDINISFRTYSCAVTSCEIDTFKMAAFNRRRTLELLSLLLRYRRKRRIASIRNIRRQAKQRTVWVRNVFRRRIEKGEYENLVRELQLGDREVYYFRHLFFRVSAFPLVKMFALSRSTRYVYAYVYVSSVHTCNITT